MFDTGDQASIERVMDECEEAIGYRFRDRDLLKRCLTHASVAVTRLSSNERLEFLGDAILGVIICESLFERFPSCPEGELTRMKSSLVSRSTCALVSERHHFDKFLFLGKGLTQNSPIPMSIMAAVFEALIAGIYLDGGSDEAREFVHRMMRADLEGAEELHHGKNFKSVLQQLSQKNYGDTPVYQLLDEKGPDHSKCFKVSACVGEQTFASAWGASKKEAEQRAAHNALCEIQGRDIPHTRDEEE